MPRESLPSAAATSPRRPVLDQAVEQYAERLLVRHPEVIEVIWFGSWVTGQPSRYSDVDLCLLLSGSAIPRIRDRIPEYLPDRFPGGIDIFPYTLLEFDGLRISAPSWWRAIRAGRTVARRPAAS